MSKLFYLASQASLNLVSIFLVLYLSLIGQPDMVVKIGVFFSILAVLQSTMSFRYEVAIFMENDPESEIDIISTAILNSTFVFLVIMCGALSYFYFFPLLLSLNYAESVLLIIACFVASLNFIIRQVIIKNNATTVLSKLNVISFLFIVIAVYWLVNYNLDNMFIGFLFFYCVANAFVIGYFFYNYNIPFNNLPERYLSTLKKHINFAKFSTPGLFVNLLSQNILVLYFAGFDEKESVAQLIILLRILSLPLTLFSMPISHLFSTKLAFLINEGNDILKFYIRMIISLFSLSILYHFFLYVLPATTYEILGLSKNILLPILFILLPFSIVRMTLSPLTNLMNVLKKQKLAFVLQMLNLTSVILLISINPVDIYTGVLYFVCSAIVCQVTVFYFLSKVVLNHDKLLR